MYEKIISVVFSATGNTRKYTDAMRLASKLPSARIDITAASDPEPRFFGRNELVIFGAPVYSGRIPVLAAERFSAFHGDQTPCILAASYGNRHYDDALLEMADIAEKQGFRVIGGAALVARHTFGKIQTERPDAEDLASAADFMRKILLKTSQSPVQMPGNRPYRDGGKGGKFRPSTLDLCTECGLCVKQCPAGAISPDCRTVNDSCISCFRCIRNCPVGAKQMQGEGYKTFADSLDIRLKDRRENEFFL